jgi:hypothetical protein
VLRNVVVPNRLRSIANKLFECGLIPAKFMLVERALKLGISTVVHRRSMPPVRCINSTPSHSFQAHTVRPNTALPWGPRGVVLCTYDTWRLTAFETGLIVVEGALIGTTESDISIDPVSCAENWRTHEEYTADHHFLDCRENKQQHKEHQSMVENWPNQRFVPKSLICGRFMPLL